MISERSIQKLIKGIIISKETGEYLLDLTFDVKLNPFLISSFTGAISMFGNESIGKIREIDIKGLDLKIIVVNKYGLILTAILDAYFPKDQFRHEAEKVLEMFYLENRTKFSDSYDLSNFYYFKIKLKKHILDYFDNLELSDFAEEEDEIEVDYGFFTEIIKKTRNFT